MRPAIPLTLSAEQQQTLEQWIRSRDTAPVVRLRCQLILLKAQGRTAQDIGSIVGMCKLSVHHWIGRYRNEGIRGLLTKKGQGRKPLLDIEADAPAVIVSVKAHRQSVRAAKAAYEANGGKPVSEDSFRAFLKALATPISVSESGWVKSRIKNSMSRR
jgi:transposase